MSGTGVGHAAGGTHFVECGIGTLVQLISDGKSPVLGRNFCIGLVPDKPEVRDHGLRGSKVR